MGAGSAQDPLPWMKRSISQTLSAKCQPLPHRPRLERLFELLFVESASPDRRRAFALNSVLKSPGRNAQKDREASVSVAVLRSLHVPLPPGPDRPQKGSLNDWPGSVSGVTI